MTETERLTQLRQMLGSNLIRERRAGIKMAAEMLAHNLDRNEVHEMLTALAKDDLIGTVRTDAQNALADDDAHRHPTPAPPPDYVFGAKCKYCHTITYLDKRKVCQKQGDLNREVVVRDGQVVNAISVTCEHCGKEFKAFVPCEGYK